MIMAILTLTCGVFLVFNPFKGVELLTKVVGGILLLYGLLDFTSSIRIRKTLTKVQKVIEDNKIKDAEVIEDNTSENRIKKGKKEEDE